MQSDYPYELIKVIIGSDGSTDRTNDILLNLAKKYPNIDIHLLSRMGKNSVLNILSPLADTEIIFYMDADCRLAKDSIKRLLSVAERDDIGAVISSMNSINLDNSPENLGVQGEVKYQQHEQLTRINESKISSTVTSLGAFYCIKSKYYKPLPNKNVCDDWMPLMNVLMNKKRVVFIDDTEVIEVRGKSLGNEIKRRIRITAGSLATLWASKRLLLPKYGWIAFSLWSHKILRNILPFFNINIIILILMLYNSVYFLPLFAIFVLFCLLSIYGRITTVNNVWTKLPKLCSYYVFMIFAQLIAIMKFLFEKNISTWNQKQ